MRRVAGLLLRWLLPLAILIAFGVALQDRWAEVGDSVRQVSVGWFVLTVVLATAGVALTLQAWRVVLAALGSPIPLRASARTFFVGQLGKYVPGSIWPVVVQMRLGARLGIPQTRMVLAFVVTLGLSLATGVVVGLAALPALLGSGQAWWFVLLPVAWVGLHPKVLNRLLNLLLRLTRREPLAEPLSGRVVAVACAWSVAFWVLCGLHVWTLVLALGGGADDLGRAVGGFALAFVAGLLVVVVPAGAGVRDPVLIAVLVPVLGTADAVAVGLLSRLVLVLADGLLAIGAVLAARDTRR